MAGPAPLFREIHRLRRFAHDLQEQLDRIPRQRKAQQARLAKAEQALRDAQDLVKRLKVTASEKEKALKTQHERIARFERQTNDVTGKKEYDALQLEIAHAKAECAKLEDEILTALTESEERAAEVPALQKALEQVKADLAKFEADVAPRRADHEAQLKEAQAKLQALEPNIPPDYRSQYNRSISSLGADAMAVVRDFTCEQCHTEIPRQAFNELSQDQFVMCRSCGRILYLPEGAKAPPEPAETAED